MSEKAVADSPPKNNSALQKFNSPVPLIISAIVLAGLLFFGLDYLIQAFTTESTDDAFIAAHIVSVAPRVPGQVAAVHVLDNQLVHSNDLLMEIDPADYQSVLSQKEAAQKAAEATFNASVAGYKMTEVGVTVAGATAKSSAATADADAANDTNAQANFKRAKDLKNQNVISSQEYDQSQEAAEAASANLNSARQKAASDHSKVDQAEAEFDAAKAESEAMFAQVSQAQTAVNEAQLELSYTKIFAPCDGLVTRKQVEAGDYLQTGQMIMSLVPTDVWIVANFKEDQLKKMMPGQHVSVEIDALGGRIFRAHVDSVQAGSGAAFSLLPPENATGNFVKVVQRVPVKIVFDEPLPTDKTFGPGLSVEPTVQISSFHVPKIVIAIVAIILAIAAAFIFKGIVGRKEA
ncbi:MAG TPA: HlyD family secretion protein [Verrucomicrobiae bacterium]|jgi:membrane fusion protein (multidrug efflux system)